MANKILPVVVTDMMDMYGKQELSICPKDKAEIRFIIARE